MPVDRIDATSTIERVRLLHRSGLSLREIARRASVGRTTVIRLYNAVGTKQAAPIQVTPAVAARLSSLP